MITLSVFSQNLLPNKVMIYLYSFVIIQWVVLIIIFEFMRRPWEGVEIELEKVLELQQNKILEDSISSMTMNELQSQMLAADDLGIGGQSFANKLQHSRVSNRLGRSRSNTVGEGDDQQDIISMNQQVAAQRMGIL